MSGPLFSLGPIDQLDDDEVCGICISAGIKRDGDEWLPSGIDLTNYKANPVVLRNHDPALIVGSAISIGLINSSEIGIRIKFAPPGVSDVADETRGLVKAGVLRGISAGIDPIECIPLDPRGPYGAVKVVRAELLEVSLVAIPADVDARVTARSFASRPGAAAMLRALPAISRAAIERTFERVGRTYTVPLAFISTAEKARMWQMHCRAGWAAHAGARAEDQARVDTYGLEQRQADMRALSAIDPPDLEDRTFARPRLRPYGG
jgi:HK97 family phage prohead protease